MESTPIRIAIKIKRMMERITPFKRKALTILNLDMPPAFRWIENYHGGAAV